MCSSISLPVLHGGCCSSRKWKNFHIGAQLRICWETILPEYQIYYVLNAHTLDLVVPEFSLLFMAHIHSIWKSPWLNLSNISRIWLRTTSAATTLAMLPSSLGWSTTTASQLVFLPPQLSHKVYLLFEADMSFFLCFLLFSCHTVKYHGLHHPMWSISYHLSDIFTITSVLPHSSPNTDLVFPTYQANSPFTAFVLYVVILICTLLSCSSIHG